VGRALSRRVDRGSARRIVELEELADLGHPPLLNETDVVGVLVVELVGGPIGELHRDPEAKAVLRAHLSEKLEQLDAGNNRQPPRGVEEVTLAGRSFRMDQRERNGVSDALRVDPRRLLDDRRTTTS
jgi:hypothetical protein